MVEYLKALQIPGIDLEKYIEEEMRENPMLEREAPVDTAASAYTAPDSANYSDDFNISGEAGNQTVYDIPGGFKISGSSSGKRSQTEDMGAAEKAIQFIKKKTSLKEYLLRQLSELKLDQNIRKITAFMIESLDDDGYLCESTRSIERIMKADSTEVRKALRILQRMEPSGVGARNLKECILIQLARKGLLNSENRNIIIFHFEALVKKNYSEISKKTGVSSKSIIEFNNIIRQFNPKPGASFVDGGWETYVVPDLILIETSDGYTVHYNDDVAPSLRINGYYRNLLKDPESSTETKEYIRKSFARASSFIKAIEQRKQTLLDTAAYIVDFQKEFLKGGNGRLRPLTMKMVAEGIGISESTVSRAVSGKYIQTPRGALELKSFFSSKLGEEEDKAVSAAGVMEMIRKIISNENKNKPFSDEQIRKMLEDEGVRVARRTIAKYRE
jgi:RNA polymerase sigma-54 factor